MVAVSILPLSLESVTVRKGGVKILDAVSLDLTPDGHTIIMGPNGAGKTTLLRLMHGLERARGGAVRWNVDEKEARAKQSFVFQTPILMRRSVRDNIAYPLQVRGVPRAQAQEQAEASAERVSLHNKLAMDARDLSGGERQKMALARALITKPEILFLDEPTANLDGTSTREIEEILLEQFEAGTRIVMATHNIAQAKRLATEVVFLHKGELIERTGADKFFAMPESSVARAFLKGDIIE